MTGYELLGMAMRGEIEDGTMFARVEKISRYIIKFESSMFTDGYNKAVTWSIYNLNAEWELTVEKKPKPQLDDWEKETCRRLLAKGYKWIARDSCSIYNTELFAYDSKPFRDNDDVLDVRWNYDGNAFDVLGFDFITWEDSEPTSIEWLLGRE